MTHLTPSEKACRRCRRGSDERVDDPVIQVLADAVGQRRLFEGEVVVNGVVRDD